MTANNAAAQPGGDPEFAAAIATLTARVEGVVVVPGDAGYDDERSGFQTAFRPRPDVIVGAADAEDVRLAVEFARARGLPVAVRATGHAPASAAPGGVLISTRRMAEVRVDPRARTAWAQAGARWERVVAESTPHGLAPLNGSAPHVGVVAYTLGGGLGLMAREFGYAADHVLAIEVVTADAMVRRVTAESDGDLFWALRGGRDNFGIVTSIEFELFPVARVYGGSLIFDADHVEAATAAWLAWTETVPEQVTSSISFIGLPDIEQVPPPLRGRHTASIKIVHTGEVADGERLVAPLRAVGPRLVDNLAELAYADSHTIHNDPAHPHAYLGDNVLVRDLDPETLRQVYRIAGPDAPMMVMHEVRHLGGALSRQPAVPNAVGHRDARYIVRVVAMIDGADLDVARALQADVRAVLKPLSVGRNLNFVYGDGVPPTPDQVAAMYDPDTRLRLAELKAAHDPNNLFTGNHNLLAPTTNDESDPR
ncbi:FAD-binding oxidoreductase [Embleya sp. NPDC005971]|uniref:FAD-binding oxidoreductase n=1 Tax=Embleya sp. NPDC005971 TaxID=3156724 RepID=UPI0033CAA8EE